MAAVVLDAVAVAQLADHLQVEQGALLQPLGLDQPVFLLQIGQPHLQLFLDGVHGRLEVVLTGDEVAAGKDGHLFDISQHHTAQWIDDGYRLDGVAEEFDPYRPFLLMGGEDVEHVAPHPKGAAMEGILIALVEHEGQPPQHLLHGLIDADAKEKVHVAVLLGRTEAVDAGHRGHDQHVTAGEQ